MKKIFLSTIFLFITLWGNNQNSNTIKEFIPLYSYPTFWYKNINKLKNQIVIINPDNGPGNKINNDYIKGINFLKQNNIIVYGYIATNYMNKNINKIIAEINKYKKFYPKLDGIFFDEINPNKLKTYEKLADYCHLKHFNFVALNPGTMVDKSFFNVKKFDIIVTIENDYKNINFSYIKHQFSNSKTKSAALIYDTNNTSLRNKLKKLGFYYIYITPDKVPNPWDTIY